MKRSLPAKILAVLAMFVALLAGSAVPASADTGIWYIGNEAGGCLDHSDQFDFRVFACNNDPRYQHHYLERVPGTTDKYRFIGRTGAGNYTRCLTAYGYNMFAKADVCRGSNTQVWRIWYSGTRPYFVSDSYPSLCLTKSDVAISGGSRLTTSTCAGLLKQYWKWLPST